HAPGRGQKIAVQADDHDDEALQPHAHVDDQRNHKEYRHIVAHAAQPHDLRDHDVASDQHPVEKRVGAGHAIDDQEAVEGIAAVEGHESFHHVAVGDDQAGREHHFGHIAEVAHGDEIFQVVEFADGDGEGHHHREAGINRARDEVRRENRGVPAGYLRHGEVEAHYRVHGNYQRRRQSGE